MDLDWSMLLGDAEYYVKAIALLVAYVLLVAVVFTVVERVLAKMGVRMGHAPEPGRPRR